jgi:MFS family permease
VRNYVRAWLTSFLVHVRRPMWLLLRWRRMRRWQWRAAAVLRRVCRGVTNNGDVGGGNGGGGDAAATTAASTALCIGVGGVGGATAAAAAAALAEQFSMVIGILASNLLSFPLADAEGWRYLLAVTALLSLCQLMASPFIVESPRWLLSKDEYSLQASTGATHTTPLRCRP